MTQGFFDEFPDLWDAFESQLKDSMVKWIEEKQAGNSQSKLFSIYHNLGFPFWFYSTGAGAHWKKQLEEVFFETRYYRTIRQLYEFYDLDTLTAPYLDNINGKNAEDVYAEEVKPLLDIKKQELMDSFAEMAKELDNPMPYTFKIHLDGQETALTLGFQKRYQKKKNWAAMDGYTYSFNGRTYTDIQELRTPAIEKLSENVSIARDAFGDLVLRRYTEIPTFDSGDREWDSEEIEYLMFDGRDIHLIIMRGGYRIAHLIFFEKLLTADARMKPLFEKLGWPMDGIAWT